MKSIEYNRDPDLIERITKRRELIRTEGNRSDGISSNVNPSVAPEWFDRQHFQHAQKLFKNYKTIIRVSEFVGLNMVLYHERGLIPLLATGNSSTVSKLFIRYLSTIKHVTNWFEADPFDPKSKSFRSLKIVRSMHSKTAKQLNRQAGHFDENDCIVDEAKFLFISQYGMCHAQFSFVGFMAIFPKQVN
ncbi:hypothetical protein NH340_JMT07368 [Sarcoptes scabiei]|nr:hypothetical protein NH340_JMT07368 [Sarcoptes scabiei]